MTALLLFNLPLIHELQKTAPGGGRTHNLRLRRPALYPIELRVLNDEESQAGDRKNQTTNTILFFPWGQSRSGMTIAFLESLSHNFRHAEEIADGYCWWIGFCAECRRLFLR